MPLQYIAYLSTCREAIKPLTSYFKDRSQMFLFNISTKFLIGESPDLPSQTWNQSWKVSR